MTPTDRSAVRIRRANEGDNVLLSKIGVETFSDAFRSYNTPHNMEMYLRSSFSPEIQAAELAEPLSLFLIAEVDGKPVGYARLREETAPSTVSGSRQIEIVRFYARTKWIGRKVGAALMQACLREAAAKGCDVIWLDVWEKNERACAFYQKWGFKQVGSQPFRLGDDVQVDLLMERPVLALER